MPKGLKIVTALMLAVIALASMGAVGVRDMSRRPDYCITCHFMEPYVASWMSSDYMSYTHATSGVSCQRCHERGIQELLREVVVTVRHDYELPFEDIDFPGEVCQRCHGDYDRLAQRTQKLRYNPHDSPHGRMECHDCHYAHKPSIDTCAECHEPMAVGTGWISPQEAAESTSQ